MRKPAEFLGATVKVTYHMVDAIDNANRVERARIVAASVVAFPAFVVLNVVLPAVYTDAMDDLRLAHQDEVCEESRVGLWDEYSR